MADTRDGEILQRIHKTAGDILKAPQEKMSLDARYIEDLGADSLDIVTLLMALEEEFNENISDEEAKELTTVGATIEFIKRKLDAKG